MQFSHIRNFVLLVRNRTIEMPSNVGTPHSEFQINHAKHFRDMNFQNLAYNSEFLLFFSSQFS